jgi:hypothetical protein
MQPRIYTYKITFEEVPYWYWGVHKERRYNDGYLGSPVTHKWMWEFYTPHLQILEIFPYSEEGWVEANSVERRLILPDLNNPLCLNEGCAGTLSLEACRRGAETYHSEKDEQGKSIRAIQAAKILHSQTDEQGRSIHGVRLAERNHREKDEQGKSLFSMNLHAERDEQGRSLRALEWNAEKDEQGRSINAVKGGEKAAALGLGVHARTEEQKREHGRKGGLASVAKGVGAHAPEMRGVGGRSTRDKRAGFFSEEWLQSEECFENWSKNGKKNGAANVREKRGICGRSPEKMSEDGRKGIAALMKQRWQCTVTGKISNAGSLTTYQRARGIDPSNRIRIQ